MTTDTDSRENQSSDEQGKIVRVSILGQEYPIRADADEEYIREIAAFLDKRMRAVHQAEPSRPPLKIAILTALNLTDELFALRRERQEIVERFEQKAKEFSKHIDQGLME
jgi:cell division protein ZapA